MRNLFAAYRILGVLPVSLLGLVFVLQAEPVPEPGVSQVTASSPEEQSPSLCWLGQEYRRFRQEEQNGILSEEYLAGAETEATWTQRVTVRRIPLKAAVGLELLGTGFVRELTAGGLNQVEQLQASPKALVLLVGSRSGDPLTRILSCVLLLRTSEGVTVLQYTQRPARVEATVAQLQLNGWKERFLAQARLAGGVGEP